MQNPDAIFRAAVADANACRNAEEQRRHIWLHKKAIRLRPSLAGVRLSYALRAWKNLAAVYPPALRALKRTRDLARKRVLTSNHKETVWCSFHDYRALNEYLSEVK